MTSRMESSDLEPEARGQTGRDNLIEDECVHSNLFMQAKEKVTDEGLRKVVLLSRLVILVIIVLAWNRVLKYPWMRIRECLYVLLDRPFIICAPEMGFCAS